MIRARAVDEIIEQKRLEAESGGERYVALRLDLEDEQTGAIALTCGGRWDRRHEAFAGPARKRVVVQFHPGQAEAVAWFKKWLEAHLEKRANPPPPPTDAELAALFAGETNVDTDPTHAYAALFAGGRRGGKTWLAVRLAIAYAVQIPGSIVWLVAPEEDGYSELDRYARATIADDWIQHATAEGGWYLCNGSEIHLKSAYDPDGLKEGRVDFVVLNEGQRCKKRAFEVLQLAIADVGGIVLVCANPPTEAKDQVWVSDFAAEAMAGRLAAVYVQFNPLLNPHIDRKALAAFAASNDQRAVEVEILGMFVAPRDAVAYNWSRLHNEAPPPSDGDCTAAFIAALGEGEGVRRVVGCDFQTYPYMAAVEYQFFGVATREEVFAWIVGEIALEGGDEDALSAAMYELGWNPEETLIVGDGTGEYQHSRRRSTDSPPPNWTGRGSFDILRGNGWRRIVRPDQRIKRNNPPIVDRMRAMTALVSTSLGHRRLFADPVKAPIACRTMREWKVVNGKPSRDAKAAHMGDGISYPIIRLFPRRLLSGNPRGTVKPEVLAQVEKQLSRVDPRDLPPSDRPAGPRLGPSPRHRGRGL